MYDAILVPVDGSETSQRAVETARGLAETTGATVHILSVVDVTGAPMSFGTETVSTLEEAAERIVDQAASAFADTDLHLVAAVRRGTPWRVVLNYCTDEGIDLVVLGQHGRTGLERLLLGSVTDRVLRSAEIPVLVVPPVES